VQVDQKQVLSEQVDQRRKLKINMASTSNLQPPIFTRNNYEMWSLTMKALFLSQYVWEIVQNGYVKLVNQATHNSLTQVKKDVLKDQRKKDGKALFYIHQAMHENI
jgi:hypothetical protein